ncbi:MAG: SdrD B-like domain-containing protein [Gemmataceae bacterium]
MTLADLARRWFRTPSVVRRPPARRPRPSVERLEARDVPASIYVRFFLDGNSDGGWSGGEAISGGRITAAGTFGTVSAAANGDGIASVPGLEAGMYNLSITPNPVTGWVYNGPPNLLVSLDTAVSLVIVTAGLVPAPGGPGGPGGPPTATGSIGDRVWSDADRDGVQDAGEAGVPGAAVGLYDGQGSWRASATSGADGHYSFGGLAAGGYQVRVTAPPGFAAGGSASVTLAAGQQAADADFGLFPDGEVETGSGVHGRMWLDDGDGVRQDGEPGAWGTVTLTSMEDGWWWTTQAGGDGRYTFGVVPDGGYTVRFEPYGRGGEGGAGGWGGGFAPMNAGDDPLRDSDADGWGEASVYADGDVRVDAGAVPPPVASGDEYSVLPSTATTVDAARGVLWNDGGPALGMTAALVSGPADGTLTLRPDGSFTYTPGPYGDGYDSFTYAASAGGRMSEPVTVWLIGAPIGRDDGYTVRHDTTLTVGMEDRVLWNDEWAGEAMTAQLVSGPTRGTLTLNADGSFTYEPDAGYVGPDRFTYRARDGAAQSAPSW